MDLKEIGLRVKHCRQDKKLTQEQLAEMIEVSPHYIYEIECGLKVMSLKTLNNLILALNSSADYILYGTIYSDGTKILNKESDSLIQFIDQLPAQKRDNLVNIISALLPYLK